MKKMAAAFVALAAAGSLAACEKPPPRATFFSGTTSEWVAPVCYSSGGQLDAQQCLTDAAQKAASGQTPGLAVSPGNVVGISVDPSIAESGWTPSIAGQQLVTTPLTSTYYRFTFPMVQDASQPLPLTVTSLGDDKGVWAVRLEVQN